MLGCGAGSLALKWQCENVLTEYACGLQQCRKVPCLCVYTGFRLRRRECCMHSCLIAPAGAEESCNLPHSQTLIRVWENSMTIHVHLLQPGSERTQTGHALWPQQRLNHSPPLSQQCSRRVLCPSSFPYACRLCGECNNGIQQFLHLWGASQLFSKPPADAPRSANESLTHRA